MIICEGCEKEYTVDEMGVHPRWKTPWKLCPDCRKMRQLAGFAKKKRGVIPDMPDPRPPPPKKFAKTPDPSMAADYAKISYQSRPPQQIVIDLTNFPEIAERLAADAEQHWAADALSFHVLTIIEWYLSLPDEE